MKTGQNVKIGQIMKQYWNGMRPYRWLFFGAYFTYFLMNVVNIIVPIFYKKFFDLLTQTGGEKVLLLPGLFRLIIIIAVIHLTSWFFWRFADVTSTVMMSKTLAKLKQNCFDYMLGHSYSFFANNFSGSLVQRVNRYARSFEILGNTFVYQIMPMFVVIIGSVLVTYFIAPVISLVIIIWVVIFVSFSLIFSGWKLKYDIKRAESDSRTTGYLSDTITNNSAVSLFTGLNYEEGSFKDISDDQAKKTRISWFLNDAVDMVQAFFILAVEFFVFYFILRYWGMGLATVGTFVLAQTYVIGLANQLWQLNQSIRHVYEGIADAKEMVEILETEYEIKDVPGAKEIKVGKGEIAFKNVGFKFNETREVLSDLNLVIKPGEKVAIIGPSGAGKTTFVRLIMRLYEVTKGKIEIDGQDIHAVTQDSLRENISLVPQDPVLFHRTLLENIRYGRREATDDEVKEAARLAHCAEFIETLPLKYDTFVGERGIKLSGGERQRVAIARAILKKAPILILDEATSSLDSHSEKLIQDALDNLMTGCTTIVIAHRLSTIRKMDRIIAMKDGKIIEEGTHAELANKDSGLYKDLWELQAGGFIQK
jgi:ATP-binding cassette subfamily B protein